MQYHVYRESPYERGVCALKIMLCVAHGQKDWTRMEENVIFVDRMIPDRARVDET